MATVSNDDRDSRPRLIYKPYSGKKGPEFEPWVVGFLDAAEGKGDDDASWADCFKGTDPQAGLTQAQTRRRTQRRREAYACLMDHIEDESLKDTIHPRNGRDGMGERFQKRFHG